MFETLQTNLGTVERCGYVTEDGSLVEVENVCPVPEQGFAFRSEDLCRLEDAGVVATWHTHVNGVCEPSELDEEAFKNWPDLAHYVVTEEGVYERAASAPKRATIAREAYEGEGVCIVLRGYLRDLYPEDFVVHAGSIAEAVHAFNVQTKALLPIPGRGRHRISIVGHDDALGIEAPLTVKELHLIPQFCGGSNGAMFQILVGAALIGAAFIPGLNVAVFAGATATWGTLLGTVGAAIFFGGVLQMVSPQPEPQKNGKQSNYLGSPGNTIEAGTRIPIGYGRHKVFGHLLSFQIDAKEVKK